MAEKPILFNTEMVRAILDGRKTQTRRLVKPTYKGKPYPIWEFPNRLIPEKTADDEWMQLWLDKVGNPYTCVKVPCQEGDILWVRETWCQLPVTPGGHTRIGGVYYYKADTEIRPEGWRGNWRPSIHMPRDAARLFLRVTGVRCERLQEITSGEAVAEGIQSNLRSPSEAADALIAFEALWNSTVRQDAMKCWGWNANPWVWVIEFERINGGRAGEWADMDTARYGDQDVLMPAT